MPDTSMINALIAQGFRGNQKPWNYLDSKNRAMETVLNEQKLAAQPVMQAMDAKAMQIRNLALDAQQKTIASGPDVSLDYPEFTVKGPKDAMMKFTQGVIDYPDQVDDPGFMNWATSLGISVERSSEEKSTWGQPQQGLDENGKPVFFRTNKEGKTQLVEGFKPEPKKGMKIYDSKGNLVVDMGGSGGGDMGAPAKNQIETKITAGTEQIKRMQSIADDFKSEYQELGFRFGQAWTGFKAKMGQGVSDEDRKKLIGFKNFQRKSIENINLYIKELTGAQMSEKEADRLRLAQPDPGENWYSGDDPITFEAKMNDVMKNARAAVARYQYYLKKGYDPSAIKQMIDNGDAITLDSLASKME